MDEKIRIPTLYEQPFWLILFYVLFTTCGVIFFLSAATGNLPMSPEVYGELVYVIDAEYWAAAVTMEAVLALSAFIVRGRIGAYMALVAGVIGCIIYAGFFTITSNAPFGEPFSIFAITLAAAWRGFVVCSAVNTLGDT